MSRRPSNEAEQRGYQKGKRYCGRGAADEKTELLLAFDDRKFTARPGSEKPDEGANGSADCKHDPGNNPWKELEPFYPSIRENALQRTAGRYED